MKIRVTLRDQSFVVSPMSLYYSYDHTPGLKPYNRTDYNQPRVVAFNEDRQKMDYLDLSEVSLWEPIQA